MEQGMKCIWLQWRSDGQAIPPSVIQSIDPWLCYLHQTSHLWTSERAWFLTHIIGNEMLTYLKLYAFWYNTASSYWDTPVVYIIAGLYIIHTILITFLSCMQSLMRITPLLEKMMFLDYRTRHICYTRTSLRDKCYGTENDKSVKLKMAPFSKAVQFFLVFKCLKNCDANSGPLPRFISS